VFMARTASTCHWNWTAVGADQRPTEVIGKVRESRSNKRLMYPPAFYVPGHVLCSRSRSMSHSTRRVISETSRAAHCRVGSVSKTQTAFFPKTNQNRTHSIYCRYPRQRNYLLKPIFGHNSLISWPTVMCGPATVTVRVVCLSALSVCHMQTSPKLSATNVRLL